MLFLVHMTVRLPHDLDPAKAGDMATRERELCQDYQRDGRWRHLWRAVGGVENYSVFDVESNDDLHGILSSLPFFPFMTIEISPLAQHPSAIKTD